MATADPSRSEGTKRRDSPRRLRCHPPVPELTDGARRRHAPKRRQEWIDGRGLALMAYYLWYFSYGILVMLGLALLVGAGTLVMAYKSWHISHGILVMLGLALLVGAGILVMAY